MEAPYLLCGERIASTGLYASAADHARFLQVLMTPGLVLEQASLDLLQGDQHNPGFGALWNYGYQAYGLEYKGVRVYHHYGTSEGYSGGVSWIPELGFGVVLLTNQFEGAAYANVYAIEELRWRIIAAFLQLPGEVPDNSTPVSEWTKYEGTYTSVSDAGVSFTFAIDGDNLTASIDPSAPTPVLLTQGATDAPYQGGDVFNYASGADWMIVAFYPGDGDGSEMEYANVYSSVSGHHVALRNP